MVLFLINLPSVGSSDVKTEQFDRSISIATMCGTKTSNAKSCSPREKVTCLLDDSKDEPSTWRADRELSDSYTESFTRGKMDYIPSGICIDSDP